MDSIDRLLLRHLSGTATAAEEAEVRRWLAADPAHPRQLERLRRAWLESGEPPARAAEASRYDTPGELDRLLGRIDAAGREPIAFPAEAASAIPAPAARPRWYESPLLRIAAMLALVIGTTVLLSTPDRGLLAAPMQSYTTGIGKRATLRLSDGSRVVLGPLSEIRLPKRFPAGAREVRLQGVAYFEVSPDPDRPFRVHAGGTVTRVVGTHFVVRAYAEDSAVEVGVAEGRVAVRPADEAERHALRLTSGQVARVDPDGASQVLDGAGLESVLAWTEGRLVFQERRLDDVSRELERWYGVKIRIPDARLGQEAITLSFRNAPLRDVLGTIAYSLNAEYEIHDRTVTLRPANVTP